MPSSAPETVTPARATAEDFRPERETDDHRRDQPRSAHGESFRGSEACVGSRRIPQACLVPQYPEFRGTVGEPSCTMSIANVQAAVQLQEKMNGIIAPMKKARKH
ncbi:MAG: hypothetical protein R2682_14455 [Pyrinomonadaceae bacterium]